MTTLERLRTAAPVAAAKIGDETPALGEYGCFVGGQWLKTGHAVEVRSPYDESLVAIVHRAGPKEIEAAIAAAVKAFQLTRKLPSWKRADVLEKISAGIAARREDFARTIALEAGKPIRTARAEVDRAIFTFKVAAEESKRIYGEIVPLDWLPGTEGREGTVRRVALGPIVGISPFNFPLNLVAHKVAPALAAGDPIIIRPASQTPVSALKLAEVEWIHAKVNDWPILLLDEVMAELDTHRRADCRTRKSVRTWASRALRASERPGASRPRRAEHRYGSGAGHGRWRGTRRADRGRAPGDGEETGGGAATGYSVKGDCFANCARNDGACVELPITNYPYEMPTLRL